MLLLILLFTDFSIPLANAEYGGYEASPQTSGTYGATVDSSLEVEGKAVNNPGMDATSKACRYDDGPGWSDCDPFELVRFRVLRLIHGGSQCEQMKNITKHCTPHDFPVGTHWLIQEHRKCISELNRLKTMIADLYKFIETMHAKGKQLFAGYLSLKSKLETVTATLEKLKVDGDNQQTVLQNIKDEIEEWKTRARDLQVQLDELKAKFHDLEAEEHEISIRNEQLTSDISVIAKENEGTKLKIAKIMRENEELKRRILESVHIKEQVKELKLQKSQLSLKLEKTQDQLQDVRDKIAEMRITLLAANLQTDSDIIENKDTHVDLSMEMFITHNKTKVPAPTYKPIYYTTLKYESDYGYVESNSVCLISYYGVTNETCWYETGGENSEDSYVDALGHHLVEAHWKYFTIDVKDQTECDKAAHLHYEFLLNRCSPKHYLPVLSVYRDSKDSKELGTHIYPKVQPDGSNSCWITFLGAHGHCESHSSKYNLYNTPDTEDQNSGGSKASCLARAKWWMKYCDTPVIVTYVPEGVSTNWENSWIMHDSHGGRMFEDSDYAKNHINPDSLNPNSAHPSKYNSEYKSMEPKVPDYHDSPEYRKSLHLQGKEKEELLSKLRQKLGLGGKVQQVSNDVKQFEGMSASAGTSEYQKSGYQESYQTPIEPYQKPQEPYPASEEPYPASEEPYSASEEPYPASQEPYPASKEPYSASEEPYPAPQDPYPAPQEPYQEPEEPYTEPEEPYKEPEPEAPYPEAPKYEEEEVDASAEKYIR